MSEDIPRRTVVDEEHLKLLSIGFMISASINAFFSLFALFYIFFGVFFATILARLPRTTTGTGAPPPAFIGWIVGGIGLSLFLIMLTFAALKFWVATCIKRRKSRTFCLVIAAFCCLEIPYGLLLGVFTFIVLGRPEVERLFDAGASFRPSL